MARTIYPIMGAMHKCLQVSELQVQIFKHLEGENRTLADLALTCRAFKGIMYFSELERE